MSTLVAGFHTTRLVLIRHLINEIIDPAYFCGPTARPSLNRSTWSIGINGRPFGLLNAVNSPLINKSNTSSTSRLKSSAAFHSGTAVGSVTVNMLGPFCLQCI